MTQRDDKGDTLGNNPLKTTSSHPDPRLVAMARMLARQAAERDFVELLRRHGKVVPIKATATKTAASKTRQSPNRRERP